MANSQTLNIIPAPVSVQRKDGVFELTPETRIFVQKRTKRLGQMLHEYLAPVTGYDLDLTSRDNGHVIELVLDSRLGSLGPEGYRLEVRSDRVEIRAPQPAGVFYGIQSFRQLLPPEAFRKAKMSGVSWQAPCAVIEDTPRFSWRGSMLDTCRHFIPKEFIFKYIDLLAMHKMNSLHLHLTDDQGWRIEIKRFPKLTQVGAWRKETMAGRYDEHRFDGVPHGGFYFQDDIREIVSYASDRFVNVVPEIEMPGHSQAALAAYPELGNTGKQLDVFTQWGVNENVFNVDDSTISFLQGVLDEVMALFPSKFIHVGGDEVPKKQWQESPRAQAKIKELGLKDESELQSWFIHQMDSFLAARGRRLIGWDEILEGGLAPGATVMSWRGTNGGIAAAKAGHDVVMAPTEYTYFDYYQSLDRALEPLAIGGFVPLEKVYSYDPVPDQLNSEEAKHVLGVQYQLWTEYIPSTQQLEYMAFPRGAALAEVAWTPLEKKDLADFESRLSVDLLRLRAIGVNFRPPSKG